MVVSRWCKQDVVVMWLGYLVMATAVLTQGRRSCEFPKKLLGRWFQKGMHNTITIEKNHFLTKGTCVEAQGDMFLLEDRHEQCYRCVVMYEKHTNVLQYRETYCDEPSTLREACTRLTVDGHLHSLFRVDATPIACPFHGSFSFTYNRGQEECKNPPSTADSCTHDSMMVFRFQACVNVDGSERITEELTCLASWKEGSMYYLVGRMVQKMGISYRMLNDAESYRCFIYENNGNKRYVISQSADATCDGLTSASEGSRIMRLHKVHHPASSCRFPEWLSHPHRWSTLDSKRTFIFNHHKHSHTLRLQSTDQNIESKMTCIEEVSTGFNMSTVVVYSASGCNNGFICMSFHKRDDTIVEVQMGQIARSHQEACSITNFEFQDADYVTLVESSAIRRPCPTLSMSEGFIVEGIAAWLPHTCSGAPIQGGCQHKNQFEFVTECNQAQRKHQLSTFVCHGSWFDGERTYLVAGEKTYDRRYCFVYTQEGKVTRISASAESCQHNIKPGVVGQMIFNITANGKCDYELENAVAMATESTGSRTNQMTGLLLCISIGFFFVRIELPNR